MFKFSPFLYIFVISANIKWMETKNWIPGNKNDNVIQLIQLMALRIVHRNTIHLKCHFSNESEYILNSIAFVLII